MADFLNVYYVIVCCWVCSVHIHIFHQYFRSKRWKDRTMSVTELYDVGYHGTRVDDIANIFNDAQQKPVSSSLPFKFRHWCLFRDWAVWTDGSMSHSIFPVDTNTRRMQNMRAFHSCVFILSLNDEKIKINLKNVMLDLADEMIKLQLPCSTM